MKVEKLGNVFKITSGGTPNRSIKDYYDGGTIPWVKTGDLKVKDLFHVNECITEKGLENSSAKIFPENTILIAMYGATIGACSILRTVAATNQACAALLPNDKVDTNYLYYYLMAIKPKLIDKGVGGGQPNISGTILKDIEFPIPDLKIQQEIAQVLEQADKARQQRKAANALTDQFLHSSFLSLFGDPVKNEKGWEVKKIGDLIDFMTSGSRGWAEYYSETGDVFLRINNVGYSELKLDDIVYVNAPDTAEAKRTEVRKGDVLFSITADLGRTALIPDNFPRAFINQHLAILRLNRKIVEPLFVSYYFATKPGRSQIINKGGVKLGLNFDDIKNLKIYQPPLTLQQQFAGIVAQAEQLRQKQRESERELKNLFQGLLQRYFG